jgi:distribution and morphology protein 10
MLGHISGAYAARVTRDLSLCSRFDFNVYSYESEWAMGMEWWMRRAKSKRNLEDQEAEDEPDVPILSPLPSSEAQNEVIGVVKARASTTTVSFSLLRLSSLVFMPDVGTGRFFDVGRAIAQFIS